jgi:hypothetical protein
MDPKAFIAGMSGSALLIGAVAGATILNVRGTALFAAFMAAGAAVATLVSSRWPGLGVASLKLWLVAILANPAFLVGAGYSIQQYECLGGRISGWDCMFSQLGLVLCALSILPPAVGLSLGIWRRRRDGRTSD